MKQLMFVIYDSKANAYMQPWFLTQQGMAQRAFSDCVNDADHNFGRHPEDYTLFQIGEFDDQTAKVEWTTPKAMGNGIEYVLKPKPKTQHDWIEEWQPGDTLAAFDAEVQEKRLELTNGDDT